VVALDRQEIEARGGRGGEVGLFYWAVLPPPATGLEIDEKLRPGLLGFVDEEHVAASAQLLRTERGVGAADHHEAPAPAGTPSTISSSRCLWTM